MMANQPPTVRQICTELVAIQERRLSPPIADDSKDWKDCIDLVMWDHFRLGLMQGRLMLTVAANDSLLGVM